ncbi:hypothetical protein CYMTET_43730 [Cymbomonas tetramitiformis]|uniref:DCD domain-containing protein n=1 Tax=Cymbomonas tetramitiformis TaxID=36881 RepID=A0AAE0F1C9_9CHLO|nr:hypothetical protein CYMTET_43730 [Cymbomonas tetramitiformis]
MPFHVGAGLLPSASGNGTLLTALPSHSPMLLAPQMARYPSDVPQTYGDIAGFPLSVPALGRYQADEVNYAPTPYLSHPLALPHTQLAVPSISTLQSQTTGLHFAESRNRSRAASAGRSAVHGGVRKPARQKAVTAATTKQTAGSAASRKVQASEAAKRREEDSAGFPEISFTSGFIFRCSSQTLEECMTRYLFGSSHWDWDSIKQIGPETAVFLYDTSKKILHGIFVATEKGMNLEPGAWDGRFPAQARVRVWHAAPPLPLQDVMSVVGGKKRFKTFLDETQVSALLKVLKEKSAE